MSHTFDSPFCNVSYLPADRVVLIVWKQFCRLDDYRRPALFALELLRANVGSSLVIDARRGFEDDPADVDWAFQCLLPAMAETGCKAVAFIMNEANDIEDEMDMWGRELRKYFELRRAASYEDAMKSLV